MFVNNPCDPQGKTLVSKNPVVSPSKKHVLLDLPVLALWSAEAPTDPQTPKSLKWPKSDFKVTFPTLGKVTP